MKQCFIVGCTTADGTQGIFQVPAKDNTRYVQWRNAVHKGKQGQSLRKKDFVCHRHFKEEEICKGRTIGGEFFPLVWKLLPGVVPSLNLPAAGVLLFFCYHSYFVVHLCLM